MPSPKDEPWYHQSPEDVLGKLDASRDGLGEQEIQSRLEEHGRNTIRTEQQVSAWRVLMDQFTSPMIYVLLVALVVTLVLQSWGDAIVIGLVLVVNATIGFIQEYRAETAVQALMEMVSPKAKVRRDGEEQEVKGEQIVPGDIVLLEQGEMVPADLRLIDSQGFQVNEAALTGESVPAKKNEPALDDAESDLPPADQTNMAFMGTAVTAGRAVGVVVATGAKTELGKVAEDIRAAGEIDTPLQQRMDRLAKWIAVAVLILAVIAFGVGLAIGRDVEEMFLLAVSLSVAAIPAGLPVVMTVALAVGVRRMARRHAVIRHLPAVETLGSTTVIVSDKTGTLTQNKMTVQQVYAGDALYEIEGEPFALQGKLRSDGEEREVKQGTPLYQTLLVGLLNNEAEISASKQQQQSHDREEQKQNNGESTESGDNDSQKSSGDDEDQQDPKRDQQDDFGKGDPMEIALLISAAKAGLSREEIEKRYPQVDSIPFQTERRFSATIHDVSDDEEGPLVLVKGAPEVIAEMSRNKLTDAAEHVELDKAEIEKKNEQLASQGLRVLGMAIGRGEEAVKSIKSEQPEGFTFVGMQGLLDPPRPEAIEAVDDCHRAGIRVLMVTGDHAQTAAAIAHKVHVDRPVGNGQQHGEQPSEQSDGDSEVAEDSGEATEHPQATLPEAHIGRRFGDLSDKELDDLLRDQNVYARVKPEHKVRIVNRLKANQHVVAVTGDGVNDAPALKAAHLGAAMGETGTDVAKEASDMVITDDNFASVYSAVEEGRTAFRNIRMATFFLLSTGAADILIILTALVIGWPLPLLPAQILWCNVVTNGIADVALGFEPGEEALFRRAPRPISEGVLDRVLIERLVIIGIWLSVGTLGVFYWVASQASLELARVSALTTLVLFQMFHVFNCRSEDVSIFKKSLWGNKVLLIGVAVSLAVHIVALYLPWTQQLFDFQPLPWQVWLVAICVAATAIIVNEGHKALRPRERVNRESWQSVISKWKQSENA